MRRSSTFLAMLLVAWMPIASSWAQVAADRSAPPPSPEAVVAGELLTEPPTLHNLGFEWFIQGDSNRNASVAVSYRLRGQTAWAAAMPLLRLQGERIYAESRVDLIAPNMFAGSVLDLQPDTEYEVRFAMSDPDGVHGTAERVLTVRTRAEPEPWAGGRVFHVYPHGHDGPKIEPPFEGLMCACNFWCAGIFTNYSGSSGFYIADNVFIGRNDPEHMMVWRGDVWAQFEGVDGQVFPPRMLSYVAVKLYGPGHVVAYNYIANFHDGINVETYGSPDGAVTEFSGPGGTVPLEPRQFETLEDYSRATGQDRNSVLVDYGIFRNVPQLDARDASTLQRLYRAEDFDFRLKEGSAAADLGVRIPNVTDDFSGGAPDLGALEIGAELPHYGPRPL